MRCTAGEQSAVQTTARVTFSGAAVGHRQSPAAEEPRSGPELSNAMWQTRRAINRTPDFRQSRHRRRKSANAARLCLLPESTTDGRISSREVRHEPDIEVPTVIRQPVFSLRHFSSLDLTAPQIAYHGSSSSVFGGLNAPRPGTSAGRSSRFSSGY